MFTLIFERCVTCKLKKRLSRLQPIDEEVIASPTVSLFELITPLFLFRNTEKD